MRFIISVAAAIVLFWAAAFVFLIGTGDESVDAHAACSSETALLGRWRSQRVIYGIGNDGRDVRISIIGDSWTARLTPKERTEIGMAAWCHVRLMNRGGQVIILGMHGGILDKVVEGKLLGR